MTDLYRLAHTVLPASVAGKVQWKEELEFFSWNLLGVSVDDVQSRTKSTVLSLICSHTGKKKHSVQEIMGDLGVLHSLGSMRRKCLFHTPVQYVQYSKSLEEDMALNQLLFAKVWKYLGARCETALLQIPQKTVTTCDSDAVSCQIGNNAAWNCCS